MGKCKYKKQHDLGRVVHNRFFISLSSRSGYSHFFSAETKLSSKQDGAMIVIRIRIWQFKLFKCQNWQEQGTVHALLLSAPKVLFRAVMYCSVVWPLYPTFSITIFYHIIPPFSLLNALLLSIVVWSRGQKSLLYIFIIPTTVVIAVYLISPRL